MCMSVLLLVSEKIKLQDDVHEGFNGVGETRIFFSHRRKILGNSSKFSLLKT